MATFKTRIENLVGTTPTITAANMDDWLTQAGRIFSDLAPVQKLMPYATIHTDAGGSVTPITFTYNVSTDHGATYLENFVINTNGIDYPVVVYDVSFRSQATGLVRWSLKLAPDETGVISTLLSDPTGTSWTEGDEGPFTEEWSIIPSNGVPLKGRRYLSSHRSGYATHVGDGNMASCYEDVTSLHYAMPRFPVVYVKEGSAYVRPLTGTVYTYAYPTILNSHDESALANIFPAEYCDGVVLYGAIMVKMFQLKDLLMNVGTSTEAKGLQDTINTYEDIELGAAKLQRLLGMENAGVRHLMQLKAEYADFLKLRFGIAGPQEKQTQQ